MFNSKTSFPRGTQPPELEDKDGEQNEASTIQAEMLYTTEVHTSPALVLQQPHAVLQTWESVAGKLPGEG